MTRQRAPAIRRCAAGRYRAGCVDAEGVRTKRQLGPWSGGASPTPLGSLAVNATPASVASVPVLIGVFVVLLSMAKRALTRSR